MIEIYILTVVLSLFIVVATYTAEKKLLNVPFSLTFFVIIVAIPVLNLLVAIGVFIWIYKMQAPENNSKGE